MKKFFLALGVIAMTFSVAACGGDDNKDNGGNNNGGNNSGDDNGGSSSSSDSVASSIKKMCKKMNDCGGDGDECLDSFDPEQVPSQCSKSVIAWANCLAGKSCNDFANADEEDDLCPNEYHAMSECGGGDDDDDDDDFGGNDDGGDDDIDIDIDFE